MPLRVSNLSGFNVGGGAAGAITLTFSASTSATAHGGTITMPAVTSGDIILVLQYANVSGSTAPAAAYGTGFTELNTQTASTKTGSGKGSGNEYSRTCASYKISDGTETSVAGFMNSTKEVAAVYIYTPSSAVTTITLQDAYANGTLNSGFSDTTTPSASALATISYYVQGATVAFTTTITAGDNRYDINDSSCYMECDAYGQNPTAADYSISDGAITNSWGWCVIGGYVEVS